MTALNTVIN